MIRKHILPALSMTNDGLIMCQEVWQALRTYDVDVRWMVYGEWHGATYKGSPELKIKQASISRSIRALLRRLSTKNESYMSRSIGNLIHHNPAIVFFHALDQIKSYSNLIDPVLDSLRFVTSLGWDVLMYTLLAAFSDPIPNIKSDGVNVADWLQSECSAQLFSQMLIMFQTLLPSLVNYSDDGLPHWILSISYDSSSTA